jgi:hypothetical protein
VTPYWRVLREGGRLNENSGGIAAQAAKLKLDGHRIESNGTSAARVRDFERRLVACQPTEWLGAREH